MTTIDENRYFPIPAKANTKWEVLEGEEHDAIIRMRVSPQARTKCPALPEFWEARAITVIDAQARKHALLTSLRDRRRFPAADEGVYQDILGTLTAYTKIRPGRQSQTSEICRSSVKEESLTERP